jgi:RNA polymerase sigma-70 factor (ECF subfamily)
VRRAHHASLVSAEQARNDLVLRYASAIRRYVGALMRDDAGSDEVAQDVVLRLLSGDFAGADPNRGRFRQLLKTAIRNMVRNQWAKDNRRRTADVDVDDVRLSSDDADDAEWLENWRTALLDLTWSALQEYERTQPSSSACQLLRLRTNYPDATSDELAERLSKITGQPIKADAVRQKLRRARVKFAELLIEELADGLETPSVDRVEEELVALQLYDYVRDFLPPDWRDRCGAAE